MLTEGANSSKDVWSVRNMGSSFVAANYLKHLLPLGEGMVQRFSVL
jgi:hypothetical protein